jgi:hypothetical protein
MNNRLTKTRFGNCANCNDYSMINDEILCQKCSNFFMDQLENAIDLTKNNPEITSEEVANHLDISIDKVEEWAKKGKIRCTTLRFICPKCAKEVINQVKCPHCKIPNQTEIFIQEKTIRRSAITGLFLEERFSRERKRPSPKLRLLASLPGLNKSSLPKS